MTKIKKCINILNVLSVILSAILSAVFYFDVKTGGIIIALFNILVTLALIGSVLHIRSTINKTKFVFPNEMIVIMHLIIFSVWTITTTCW